MKHPKAHYRAMNFNGYVWTGWDADEAKGEGRHCFQRGNYREGFTEILATDEDLENGNMEYFVQHGLSNTGRL